MKAFKKTSPHLNGFSLIELLTAVAVLGILAAILIPTIANVRTKASSAKCTSQLRQIGGAFQMYLQDNNNLLPKSALGDPFSGQSPYYNRDPRRIQTLFGSYWGALKANSWSNSEANMSYDGTLSWPEWENNRRGNGPSLIGNWPLKLTNSETPATKPPWGKSYLLIENPSQAVMYTESDAELIPNAGWSSALPEKPIHGNFRNALFFDGHVEQLDLNFNLNII
ncbi:prepilin-type N-terminal cleavage/methylation domain-containing protein [Coraliomargarita sp. SDUM461003]|uniref:Prepilin-type N-terminal cleavage/methylation domain-containing protein n=1 Tax=Thalassobacterium maritimum TaxID=3041265 RepID=A0ABU1AV11_9BACT|nr:prepilin-type N-terminal cleavage/methylation domain-containing protein [Coraliomargarita sp. SDUM461003]MDQ8207988.1 prepilin-type N-terminal cleavage/methylation domain-containing protein [Coraliomargarita sp. SDUM461003]